MPTLHKYIHFSTSDRARAFFINSLILFFLHFSPSFVYKKLTIIILSKQSINKSKLSKQMDYDEAMMGEREREMMLEE
jgi:hypothetical protein